MAAFKGDDRAADGIPVEVKLDNGGYFEAFLMDIINGEALIHFLCGWLPEDKYLFSHVRFPPAAATPRSALQEKMIAEVLVHKNEGFHEGWFKCCIQMLKSDFCQFEYLDTQNGFDFGHTSKMRKPNSNPKISMDMFHVHKMIIPEDIREYAKCENVHRTLKDALGSALVNYDADRGELVIISRNIDDISRAKILEKPYLSSLSQKSRYLQTRRRLNPNLEMSRSCGFTAEFTVPKSYLGLAIGNGKVHLRGAQNIKGISAVQLIRKSNKFVIHGETDEAVKEARKLLEIKIEPYPVLEEYMSQLVGRESENIHKIIQATGAAEIYIEHIQNALEKEEQTKGLPLYIIGTVEAIEKTKLFIQFQIDHICEVQRLRAKKVELNRQIAIFVRNDTRTSASDVSTLSETVQPTRQIVSSTKLRNYNSAELEELQNLNEMLSENYEEAVDLDAILENIQTRDIDLEDSTTTDVNLENTTKDIILEDTATTDIINLEDTITTDINLEDINEEEEDLENTTTTDIINSEDTATTDIINLDQIAQGLVSEQEILGPIKLATPDLDDTTDINLEDINEEEDDLEDTTTTDINLKDINEEEEDLGDNSNVLDTPTTILNTDNLSGVQYCDYAVNRPLEEVEKVESVGFQFVEDPDFWTRDVDNTPSKPLLETQHTTHRNLTKEQVVEEIDKVISEAVTYIEQISDAKETPEMHLQEENLHLEANSSTLNCCGGVENLTKKPMVTPRLSRRKSKNFRNFSTETDDMLYSSKLSSQEKSIASKSETSSLSDSDISINIDTTLFTTLMTRGTIMFSGYLKDVSSQEECIQSQCDDQELNCSLLVDDAPTHLDGADASDDMGLEEQDSTIYLKDDKDSFD